MTGAQLIDRPAPAPVRADDSMDSAAYPRLGFVHIPKTAGTSVTNALARAYGPASFPAMTTLDYRRHDSQLLDGYKFFKGHAYRRDYERFPAGTILFTILREPVDRALSLYRYYRGMRDVHLTDPFILEASHLAKTRSAIEFIYSDSPFVIEHLRLGQARQFLPDDMLKQIAHRQFLSRDIRQGAVRAFTQEMARFDYTLTTELLSISFPIMATQLGLPATCRALTRDNDSAASSDADPADIRRALVDVNAAEFDCYDNVRRRETSWLAACLGHKPASPGAGA